MSSKSQINLTLFALLFLFIFLFFPKDFVQGVCTCSCTCFRADTLACDPTVFIGVCLVGIGCPCACPAIYCAGQRTCEKCGGWQVASRCRVPRCIPGVEKTNKGPKPQPCCEATLWDPVKPECLACSECIDKPENPRYYDNSLYPLNPYQPEPSKDKNNIFLPVKLDWDDVEGWIEGWRIPRTRTVKKNGAGERCEMTFEAGKDLVECMVGCKNQCWQKMEREWKGPEKNPTSKWNIGEPSTAAERAKKEVEKEIEYRNYLPKCIRECERNCIETHTTGAGGICPYTGTVFHCDPPSEYLKSYIIEIKGNMRNPEALKKIAILEREAELIETKFPETPEAPIRLIQIEEEIKKIKQEELEVSFFGAALDKSEFIPPSFGFFKSNRTYQWRVRACIREYKSYKEYREANELTCGAWSDWWEFKTNPTPEPNLPYDPDWAGEWLDYPSGWKISGMAKEIPKWEIRFLRWSEIDDKEFADEKKGVGKRCRLWSYYLERAKTTKKEGSYLETEIVEGEKTTPQTKEDCRENYCLNIESRKENKERPIPQLYCRPLSHNVILTYRYQETEEDKCLPQLKVEGKCQPKIVYPFPAGWPREKPYFPSPQFSNHKYQYFTKLTSYRWQTDACIEIGGERCTDWSQKWRFSVEDFSLKKPELVSPPDDPERAVGLPLTIAWSEIEGAMSYRYEIRPLGSGKVLSSDLTLDHPQLKLDTLYRWRADPCWGYEAEPARCENNWSNWFSFRTTGRPPQFLEPEGVINIPTTFSWEAVPGAKSYMFYLAPKETIAPTPGLPITLPRIAETVIKAVEEPRITIDYPYLLLNKDYRWFVETCAYQAGGLCGRASEEKMVRTIFFLAPFALEPADGGELIAGRKYFLSWTPIPGANFYQYEVRYVEKGPEEREEECQPNLIDPIYQGETKATQTPLLQLDCLGKYQWQVRACLGGHCPTIMPLPIYVLGKECCQPPHLGSDWRKFTFNLRPAPGPVGPPSLVPCGQRTDNPNTPWDETKPCQIKHLFILLSNIISFLLWRVAPILLVLLILVTAGIYYLSMGAPATIVDLKLLWKTAGIGYGIVFLAWVIVDLFLLILGYRVGIFGPWWQISF